MRTIPVLLVLGGLFALLFLLYSFMVPALGRNTGARLALFLLVTDAVFFFGFVTSASSGFWLSVSFGAFVLIEAALWHEWPSYLGYLTSFIVVGIMWANHHNLMKLVDRVDHGFMMLNLLLLMCVAFLPFPTSVMAQHLTDTDDRAIAVAFYCGCFTVTALLYFLMWWHAASGRRLIAPQVPDESVRAITRAYAPGSLLYLSATLLAFVHVAISLAIVLGLAVLSALVYWVSARGWQLVKSLPEMQESGQFEPKRGALVRFSLPHIDENDWVCHGMSSSNWCGQFPAGGLIRMRCAWDLFGSAGP